MKTLPSILQGAATLIILGSALLTDGLMETRGPLGYLVAMTPVLPAAGLLVWLSNRPQKKTAPGAVTSESGETSRNG